MAVVINTSQNIVTVSQDGPTTVVVQDVGIQGARGAAGSGSFANSSALATTGSNSFIGNQSINGNVAVTGSLTVSGSNTFRVIGPTILQGTVTIVSGSLTATVASASYATTASYALNAGVTVNTGSLLTTASLSGNTLTFTKGNSSTFSLTLPTSGGGTGSAELAFVSASSAGPAGSIIFTQGNGSTQTVTLGSSFVTAGLPNNEVVVFPTQSFYQVASNLTTLTQFGPVAASKPYAYAWTPTTSGAVVDGAYLFIRDHTNSWGSLSIGNYIAINSTGSISRASYYEVLSVGTTTYSYSSVTEVIRLINLRAVDTNNIFTGNSQATIFGTVSAPPEYTLQNRRSLGLWNTSFYAATDFTTNWQSYVALVSGSTTNGTWLHMPTSPNSGSALSTESGRYIGLSGDNSTWTYYTVNGRTFTSPNGVYYVGVTPVSGQYTASPASNIYVAGYNRIPTYPYYSSLSHITHPITPSGTADASGSIGDVSYDSSYFYVKTSAGWKRAALSTW